MVLIKGYSERLNNVERWVYLCNFSVQNRHNSFLESILEKLISNRTMTKLHLELVNGIQLMGVSLSMILLNRVFASIIAYHFLDIKSNADHG